jgi:hypothetical protein
VNYSGFKLKDTPGSLLENLQISLMRNKRVYFNFFPVIFCLAVLPYASFCQEKEVLKSVDSLNTVTTVIDTSADGKKKSKVRVYNPGKAALRSAIIPGWGQVYNKKYWKVPIIYGALGVTAAIFFYNLNTYKDTRLAYTIKYNMSIGLDSSRYNEIPDYLQPISTESLRYYRDSYRQAMDYSALIFLLVWGLNVVDAAVDAHLKGFDVSPDLSLKFKPYYSPGTGTTGLTMVMNIGKTKQPALLKANF